jgi:hypothetical protein
VRTLENVRDRVVVTDRRGGSPAGLPGPLAWLESTVRSHPALRGEEAAPLKRELLRLAEAIRSAGRL